MAASELGETDTNGLFKRVSAFYLTKAKELQRIGAWTDNVASDDGNRVISPEMSFETRGSNPSSLWKKAGEIRRELQMVIAPIYAEVVRENRTAVVVRRETW